MLGPGNKRKDIINVWNKTNLIYVVQIISKQ